ncbi:MAG: large subunit ribosomal protein L15 [Candidatus Deianiraeaceae bacterium]|jgi:large subunit ribosomal protein L15
MSEIIKALGLFENKIVKKSKRVGRGRASGLGKTCGRGQKGQGSRSGVSINWFEGGQTPLYVRLPRRGFNNIFRTEYTALHFLHIQKYIDSGRLTTTITVDSLISAQIIGKNDLVKILSKGDCPKGVKIEAHAFSKTAIDEIQKSGGSHSVIGGNKQQQ